MANQPKTSARSGSRRPRRRLDIWNKIAVLILSVFLVGCISVFFVLVGIINDPNGMRFSKDGLSTLSNSRIFDDSGNMIYEFGSEIREDITYDQLPQSVIDAFLAVEDSRYFEHSGFDLPRFIAAGINNLRKGDLSQGGSTLTMQMIDNAFTKNQEEKLKQEAGTSDLGTLEKIKLKIQEIYLSLIAEQNIDKEAIMEFYLNRIWFGSSGNTRGIQKAAKYYFNKDVSELNTSEAAFLAGVVNAPYTYNPLANRTDTESGIDHLAAGTERRNTTLQLMLQHGYITEEEYNLAKNTDLALSMNYIPQVSNDANQAYIDQTIDEVINLTGQDPAIIPMDIYTSLNTSVQNEVDKIMKGEIIDFPNEAFDIGLSITNNTNGEIIAVGPGRYYHSDEIKRDNSTTVMQPGSIMKPILGYSSAFDILGWSTVHTVNDKATDFFKNGHIVQNSDGRFDGRISLAYALGVSKNTTALQTMFDLTKATGYDYWIDFCRKLGFSEDVCEQFNEQYVIGSSEMYASPVQMSSAYTMLANGGVRVNAHRVRRVIRRSDKEEIAGNSTENELISTQAAYMMSTLLEKVVTGGYQNFNNILQNPNYTVYGKSGTTGWEETDGPQYGIPAGSIKDEWSVAYTSAFSIATWSGYLPKDYVNGYYITWPVLNQATAFHINDYLTQFLQDYGDYHALDRPDGISNYNGGLIKTEDLAAGDPDAGKAEETPKETPTTPQEDPQQKQACIASGGSYDNGACSCPNGYELNGSACVPAVQEPQEPQPSEAQTACEASGGSFANGACYCPEGYEFSGSACIPAVQQPIEPDPGTPEDPDDITGWVIPWHHESPWRRTYQ